jgi:hypothetical protein
MNDKRRIPFGITDGGNCGRETRFQTDSMKRELLNDFANLVYLNWNTINTCGSKSGAAMFVQHSANNPPPPVLTSP